MHFCMCINLLERKLSSDFVEIILDLRASSFFNFGGIFGIKKDIKNHIEKQQ